MGREACVCAVTERRQHLRDSGQAVRACADSCLTRHYRIRKGGGHVGQRGTGYIAGEGG